MNDPIRAATTPMTDGTVLRRPYEYPDRIRPAGLSSAASTIFITGLNPSIPRSLVKTSDVKPINTPATRPSIAAPASARSRPTNVMKTTASIENIMVVR